MACGVWLGLVRLGWNLPLPWPDQLISHGPLMVCGFLGTLIALERAVALTAWWGYAAPVTTAAGALLLDFGVSHATGPFLITSGSLIVTMMFAVVLWRKPSLEIWTMALGAVVWVVGNALWLSGASIFRVVFWWASFLVLTIAGERLELGRALGQSSSVRLLFALTIGTVVIGSVGVSTWPAAGVRVIGVGLMAVAAWLVRFDVARRSMSMSGLSRFMGACLLGGYAWLGFGGAVALATGAATPGPLYDAVLHSVFLGFVMSMVFAHAPVILPAVLGIALKYRPAFYVHVAVLHVSLVLRVVGDLADVLGRWRLYGGLLNAVALLLFVFNTVRAALKEATPGPKTRPTSF